MWERTRRLRLAGWVDGIFAAAFLLLLAVLWWPALLGPGGVPGAVPLLAIALVAFSAPGDAGFWPRLRFGVLWTSLLITLGGVAMQLEHVRLEHVTQPAFVALCVVIGLWSRRAARRDRNA